ncbi:MAG: pilus assembly protein [Bacilli bacterium]|nr:pilus assembly protein [Bacilli bacterium]
MLNNKGQSLILFVLFIPMLLLIIVLVVDIGKALSLKSELDSINNIVLDYGLDNLGTEDLVKKLGDLVRLNKSDIDSIDINIEDNKIYIKLEDSNEELFLGLVDISLISIKSSYVGYTLNDEKRIERIVGD